MPVNIIIDSKFDDKGIKDAQRQLQNMAGQAAKRVAQVGAAVAAAGAVAAGKLAVDAVRAASDFEESVNAVNVAFGEAAQGVLEIGENAATAMGLSQNEFNQAAVRFSAFAERVVGEGGDVAGFIGDVSQRAADFASVFNIEVSEALQVFQSGLAGEAEPLKRFGINLLQTEVAAFAMANGISESASAMTESEKIQARYGLLLEQTAKTQGDFQNTSDSLANSQRILRAEIENLQIEIGSALIPVAKDLVNTFANALLPRLEEFGAWINSPEGVAAVKDFGDGLVGLFEAALDFGGWVLDNLELLKNLGIAIAGITASVYAYQAATVIATVATKGFTASLLANPFGAVAVALTLLATGAVMAATSLGNFGEEATPAAERAKELEQEIKDLERAIENLPGKNIELERELANLRAELVRVTGAASRTDEGLKNYAQAAQMSWSGSQTAAAGFEDVGNAASGAADEIVNLTVAEQARLRYAEQQRYNAGALAAGFDVQTKSLADFAQEIYNENKALFIANNQRDQYQAVGSQMISVNEDIERSVNGVTESNVKATEAQNAFTRATPGSPGPGGMFEAIFPDGSTRLVNIEGEEFRGLSTGGQQLGRAASGAISSVGRGSRGQALPTFINPETNRKIVGNIQGDRLQELLQQGFEEVKLATGGIVTSPTRALIGEAGPEAVIPLNKLDRMKGGNTFNIYVTASSRTQGALAGEEVVNALKNYNTNNGDFNRALTGIGS